VNDETKMGFNETDVVFVARFGWNAIAESKSESEEMVGGCDLERDCQSSCDFIDPQANQFTSPLISRDSLPRMYLVTKIEL
jgi:hypothetical protein